MMETNDSSDPSKYRVTTNKRVEGNDDEGEIQNVSTKRAKYNTKRQWEMKPDRFIGIHIPYELPCNIVELNGKRRTVKRGKCILCRRKVATMCKTCNHIHLCLLERDNHMACWEWFHTQEQITGLRPSFILNGDIINDTSTSDQPSPPDNLIIVNEA